MLVCVLGRGVVCEGKGKGRARENPKQTPSQVWSLVQNLIP